jgi:hypothetical protein
MRVAFLSLASQVINRLGGRKQNPSLIYSYGHGSAALRTVTAFGETQGYCH